MTHYFKSLTLLTPLFLLAAQVNARTIHRNCHARIEATITSVSGNFASRRVHFSPISTNFFKAKGACGATVPNRCRERASAVAKNCVLEQLRSNEYFPRRCQGNDISGLEAPNFRGTFHDAIEQEVCDSLYYLSGAKAFDVTADLTLKVTGNKKCGASRLLEIGHAFRCRPNLHGVVQRYGGSTIKTRVVPSRSRREQRIVRLDSYINYANRSMSYDIRLYSTEQSMRNNNLIKAYNRPGDEAYQGCGLQAAKNMLAYFGIYTTQHEVNRYVKTHKFGILSKNIATYPSELRDGLNHYLNNILIDDGVSRPYKLKATHLTGKNQRHILEYLKKGFPVVALINNGGHWVVVAGYKANKMHPEDINKGSFIVWNNYSTYLQRASTLDLSIKGGNGVWAAIESMFPGGSSYKAGSIIVFSKRAR